MEKSKPMMIIIIALLVLLLATVVVVTIYLISAFGGDDNVEDAPRQTPTPVLAAADIEWRELGGEITANLQEPPQGVRSSFVMTQVTVGVNTTAPSRELNEFNTNFSYLRARTIASEVLFSATYAEARTPEGRSAIEERILNRLQLEFGPLIVGVGTPDWVVT